MYFKSLVTKESSCIRNDSNWSSQYSQEPADHHPLKLFTDNWMPLPQWNANTFYVIPINTLRPRQNGRRFADDNFKRIFFNENVRISIKISLKFVPKGPINNNPALVQIMAWRRSGDKPLSEPMMVSLLTHICVTRPQWVNDTHLPNIILNLHWIYFPLPNFDDWSLAMDK